MLGKKMKLNKTSQIGKHYTSIMKHRQYAKIYQKK